MCASFAPLEHTIPTVDQSQHWRVSNALLGLIPLLTEVQAFRIVFNALQEHIIQNTEAQALQAALIVLLGRTTLCTVLHHVSSALLGLTASEVAALRTSLLGA